ncbi:uncharacterized protein LOC135378193 isoform X2 [Ornithodoros turicata]|uniref:uncharacterized protein LOC135378193 isoform X2 n=1 Tax=Ornithodoros turicata TaxID=34597 RepID=UPI003138F73B
MLPPCSPVARFRGNAKADAPSQGSSCMATQRQYCSTAEEFQKQVLRLLHVVRFTLQQHSDVLQAICNQGVNNAVAQTAPNFLVKAAFTTSEALEEFSKSLNEERQAQLVDKLSHRGGTDVRHATRSILSYLLTDTGVQLAWTERKTEVQHAELPSPYFLGS